MVVGAILVVGSKRTWLGEEQFDLANESSETLGTTPLCCFEILGQSVLQRTIHRLQSAGVKTIAVVTQNNSLPRANTAETRKVSSLNPTDGIQAKVERTVREQIACGVDIVLLMRMGAYAEFDVVDLLRFHRDKNQALTSVVDGSGHLDILAIRAHHIINSGRTKELKNLTGPTAHQLEPYHLKCYVNRLEDARDLRQLAIDALLLRNSIHPSGREIRPGVWYGVDAKVDRRARVVAPAYIGAGAKVRANALITRFSSLERDCSVAQGTVIEDTSVLAETYLGKGLNVAHAVVSGSLFVRLRNNITVEIDETRLLGHTSPMHVSQSHGEIPQSSGFLQRVFTTAWSQLVS